jgi:hypothetical protein
MGLLLQTLQKHRRLSQSTTENWDASRTHNELPAAAPSRAANHNRANQNKFMRHTFIARGTPAAAPSRAASHKRASQKRS